MQANNEDSDSDDLKIEPMRTPQNKNNNQQDLMNKFAKLDNEI